MPNSADLLIVAPQPFFTNRGTPLNVHAMAVALSDAGYKPHLLVYPLGNDIAIPNVVVHRSWPVPFVKDVPIGPSYRKLVFDLFLFFSAFFLCVRHKFRVLHGIEEGAFIAGTIGLLFRVPYVVDIDSWMCDQIRASRLPGSRVALYVFERVENYFLKRASAIITVCRALTEKVRTRNTSVPLFQIEDFPIESDAHSSTANLSELRAKFAVPADKLVIYTGNLEPYQGIDLLLQGYAALPEDMRNSARLVIVGGEDRDIQRCQKLSANLAINSNVTFAGRYSLSEAQAFLKVADLLVSPRIEGVNTPLKVYSYMQSGVPIVATDIVSHTQVLSSDSAFLCPPTPQGMAEALSAALDFSAEGCAERVRRAHNAKALVEEHYSFSAFKRKVVAVYDFLLCAK